MTGNWYGHGAGRREFGYLWLFALAFSPAAFCACGDSFHQKMYGFLQLLIDLYYCQLWLVNKAVRGLIFARKLFPDKVLGPVLVILF